MRPQPWPGFERRLSKGTARRNTISGPCSPTGQGVPKDNSVAVTFHRRAAEQDFALAQFELGKAYYNGEGIARDYVSARMWLALAAAGGNEDAAKSLNVIDAQMTPAQIAEAQRRAAERQPKLANASPVPSQQVPQPSQVAVAPIAAQPAPESKAPEWKATSGTAFFVSKDGRVLTNAHVVEACRSINVVVDGQSTAASLVAKDETNDLALIATGLHPGQAAHWRLQVRRGEDIVVYGFPLWRRYSRQAATSRPAM